MENAKTEIIKQSATVIPFVLKLLIVSLIGAIVYYKIVNRFVKKKEVSKYGPANITLAQADARASSIAASGDFLNKDFDAVLSSLAGLNYNGFVRVYNAFGAQTGHIFGDELDMIQWLYSKFNKDEMMHLSTLTGGAFF